MTIKFIKISAPFMLGVIMGVCYSNYTQNELFDSCSDLKNEKMLSMIGNKLDEVSTSDLGASRYISYGVDAIALNNNQEFCPVRIVRYKKIDFILNKDDRILYIGSFPKDLNLSYVVDSIQKHYHDKRGQFNQN